VTLSVDLVVSGATVVTGRPDGLVVHDASIAISNGTIAALEPGLDVTAARRIDARGQIVFAGLVDTHTHLYQTLLKGLGDDLPLMEWLDACTLPSIPHLTPRMCYVAAALGAIESLRSGCTTVFDYMVDHADTSVYDAILQALDDVGVQGVLGRGLRDRLGENVPNLGPSLDDQLANCAELIDRYGLQRVWLAPGATWALEAESLQTIRRVASERGARITLHTDEVIYDSAESSRPGRGRGGEQQQPGHARGAQGERLAAQGRRARPGYLYRRRCAAHRDLGWRGCPGPYRLRHARSWQARGSVCVRPAACQVGSGP
jgi:5-methylthioadenosine/S-adenosylhomocysteine deaminase